MTIFAKQNKRHFIFNLYRPYKGKICDAGAFTIMKQQWLIMQKDNTHDHPRKAAIIDIIIAINTKRAE